MKWLAGYLTPEALEKLRDAWRARPAPCRWFRCCRSGSGTRPIAPVGDRPAPDLEPIAAQHGGEVWDAAELLRLQRV